MKIAIVTDSTAYLPERIKDHPNLFVIPIPVILDGKIYNEGIDIEADEYYALLNNSKEFPTTSQPALGEVLELYKSIAEQGYDTIISIHLSSGISGFVHTLHGLTDEIPGVALYPYDSKITSMPMGHMVEAALDLTEEKASLEEIFAKLDLIRDNTYAYLIVEDLNNLVRGGR
ncbi:MAG: DegV family protein, partial [Enterococcus faecalis]|nr:DegV family protein [Enterococcus faecalis]